jgi:hypothetical protein
MDWFSIDQVDPQGKLLGAQSMRYYVSQCKFMLVPTRQEKIQARYPDKIPGYGDRAWCRLEAFIMSATGELNSSDSNSMVQLFAADVRGTLRQYPHVKLSGGRYDEMPEHGSVTHLEDRTLIRSLQAEVLGSFGHDIIRKVCEEAPMCVNLSGKLLCSAHMQTLVDLGNRGFLDDVTILSLHNNIIGDAGLNTLTTFLIQRATSMDTARDGLCIDLASNSISDEGLQNLASCIERGDFKEFTSLKFKLSFNSGLTKEGAIKALRRCSNTTVTVDFSGHKSKCDAKSRGRSLSQSYG